MSRPSAIAPVTPRRQTGIALLLVIVIVAVVSIAMASFGMMVALQVRATRSQLAETQALYITEAAVHRAIGYLQGVSNWSTAALPSPNPLSLTDSTNQAVVSYLSKSKTAISLQANGYVLARGYTLPASATPSADKVRDQATIQATLSKVPTSTLWGYAIYSDNKQTSFNAVVHGSMFDGSGNLAIGNGEGVYNDYKYSSSQAPSSLQTYLNAQNANALYGSLYALTGNINVTGTGGVGTSAVPLNSVGLKVLKTISGTAYYSRRVTVTNPGTFPTVATTQVDGTVSPSTETDFKYIAGDVSDPDNGCVWSGNEVQTVTITGSPTGGNFTLTYGANTTANIAYNAPATGVGSVQNRLNALASISAGSPSGSVSVTGNAGGPYTVTFDTGSLLANTNVVQLTANGALLTGGSSPTVGVVTSQDGIRHGSIADMNITFGGNLPPNCSTSGSNGISWTGSLLTVNGTVFVNGNLTIGDSTYNDITYLGRGLIVVSGNVNINAGLHPASLSELPNTSLLGIIAMGTLTMTPPNTTPNKVIAGAFFTNSDATINAGSIVLGSVVAGNNVVTAGLPTFYQVPGLSTNLPSYMPTNGGTSFYVSVSNWKTLN